MLLILQDKCNFCKNMKNTEGAVSLRGREAPRRSNNYLRVGLDEV